METVDMKQHELDMVEKQILTDLFGGYEAQNLVYKFGFFKLDLKPKVQKIIHDFESLAKPMMDDEGKIDSANVKKYLNEDMIKLPDGKYRLIEVYQKCQPFLMAIKKYIL